MGARKKKGGKEKERGIFHLSSTTWPVGLQSKVRRQDMYLESRDPSLWATTCCLLMLVSKEVGQNQNIQTWNATMPWDAGITGVGLKLPDSWPHQNKSLTYFIYLTLIQIQRYWSILHTNHILIVLIIKNAGEKLDLKKTSWPLVFQQIIILFT